MLLVHLKQSLACFLTCNRKPDQRDQNKIFNIQTRYKCGKFIIASKHSGKIFSPMGQSDERVYLCFEKPLCNIYNFLSSTKNIFDIKCFNVSENIFK